MTSLHLTSVVCRFMKYPKKLAKRTDAEVDISVRVEFNVLEWRRYIIVHVWRGADEAAMV